MKKECKRHKWRVGSTNVKLIEGKLENYSLNVWCGNCDKKIKAKYYTDFLRKQK